MAPLLVCANEPEEEEGAQRDDVIKRVENVLESVTEYDIPFHPAVLIQMNGNQINYYAE